MKTIENKYENIKIQLDEVYEIVNEYFKYDLREDTFIAGGAIVSLLQGNYVNDYDFFFKNENARKKFTAIIKMRDEKCGDTKNAYTFTIGKANSYKHIKVQFIKLYEGPPEYIITLFDFRHCMNYYSMNFYNKMDLKILYPQLIMDRELVYNLGNRNPNGTPARFRKFRNLGYTSKSINAEQILNHLNLSEPLVDGYE